MPPIELNDALPTFLQEVVSLLRSDRIEKGRDGFGLGLAIAKQAVQAHGGTIRIQNLPAKAASSLWRSRPTLPSGLTAVARPQSNAENTRFNVKARITVL